MGAVPPLSWKNVIGYGFGDMANNLVFAMGALFLLNYYTDVAGIGAAAAGTLLASVRIYNALTDVIAGRVVDRTSTSRGSCRPFILFGGLPLLLLSVAVFSIPAGWDTAGKLFYAYVSYGLLVTAYSLVNIPYGSLASLMTQVPRERARLSASRMIMATGAFSFLALVLGPMLGSVTGLALQERLNLFTQIMAGAGAILFFVCFIWTREIVVRDSERPKLKASVGTLLANRPLLILSASALCVLAGCFSMNSSALYFSRYVLGDGKQILITIGITTLLGTLVSAPLVPMLATYAGKKGTSLLGLAIAALGYLALFFVPVTSNVLVFGAFGVASIGQIMAMTIMWALAADTVEYGEWRTGVRIEGLTYSIYSLARKCGQAFGGSIPAFLLAANGYVPNLAMQSDAVRLGILQALALVPAIAFILAFVLMLFYPLTDRRFSGMVLEIAKRRSDGALTHGDESGPGVSPLPGGL